MSDAARMLSDLFERVDGLVELRPIRRAGGAGAQEYINLPGYSDAADRAAKLASIYDVYFGVAPRTRQAGGKDAIVDVPAVWADVDSPDAVAALVTFSLPPSIVVESGTPGNLHAYWLLDTPIPPADAERLNADLAHHLGSDPKVTDASRVLRLPGTLNHKSNPPSEVRLIECNGKRYHADALAQEAAITAAATGPAASDSTVLIDSLLDALDSVSPSGNGWVACCPAHDDQHPSLSVTEGDDGKPLLKCHAGCSYGAILNALEPRLAAEVRRGGTRDGADAHSRLMQIVATRSVELTHDRHGDAFAHVPLGERRQACLRVDSRDFAEWLCLNYYKQHTAAVPREALTAATRLITARAKYEGQQRAVHRRVGGDFERLFIDLGDASWRVVTISGDGTWDVLDRSPVPFVRDNGMQALPIPQRGGSIEDMRPLVNAPDDEAWALLRGALLAAFHPFGPYFVTPITGGAGSGKTWAASCFARLVDPFTAQFLGGTASPSDVIVAAAHCWLVGLDNRSHIPRELSDLLCTLSTGAGDRRRALYTTADTHALEAKRPVIVTSIGKVMTRADLIDRSAPVRFDPIPKPLRRSELELGREFEARRSSIFGGIVEALAGALQQLPNTTLPELPRMADAALFVTAAEDRLSVGGDSFIDALSRAKGEALSAAVEAAPFIDAVVAYMQCHDEFFDSSTRLLELAAETSEYLARHGRWPGSGSVATMQLEEHKLTLEQHGIDVETQIRMPGGKRDRRVRLTRRNATA